MKWVYFEKRSTTVRMTLFPWTLASASTKSSVISVQMDEGTSSGWNKPAGCRCSVLLRWHVAQALTKCDLKKQKTLTKSRTTARSLSITKSLRRGCSVFCIPSWLFVCASLSIDWRRADEARTKTHFPWRKSPPCTVQSAAWIVVMLSRSFCSSPLLSNSARSSSKSWNVGEEIAARICSG